MIRLTREVRFALLEARRWPAASQQPVANSWAGWPPSPLVCPRVALRCTVLETVDPTTGYAVDIREIDRAVRRDALPAMVAATAEGRESRPEALLQAAWHALHNSRNNLHNSRNKSRNELKWQALELVLSPWLSYSMATTSKSDSTAQPHADKSVIGVRLTQQFEFSAAHRLHVPSLSDQQNRDLFGKCNNPHGHGHNYVLEVTIRGRSDADGSAAADAAPEFSLAQFEQQVKASVIDRLDHRHLNVDVSEFAECNPTVENIARVIWGWLQDAIRPAQLESIRLYETPKTWVDYWGID